MTSANTGFGMAVFVYQLVVHSLLLLDNSLPNLFRLGYVNVIVLCTTWACAICSFAHLDSVIKKSDGNHLKSRDPV